MKYATYYEDDRIETYLAALSKRVLPLIRDASKEQVLDILDRVNNIRGFYILFPCNGISSETESLDLRSGPQFSDMTLSGRSVLIVPNNTGTDYD